ncbi:unnamed protein product [Rotaria sordida]|uniref:Uncharacterized protein n=3 Tax=Rotaria sordida TaxID=392033 RepID=A0A814L3P3_9BILA|nr:unnamed protein product [Rotaria sordida]CAF3720181.1 unnamed protein product [Rotaria sordida]
MAQTMVKGRATCSICGKEKIAYKCGGCSRDYCFNHLEEHRQTLGKQFDEIENDRDQFHRALVERKEVQKPFPLIQQVDKWEEDSIKKIKQTAEECRQTLIEHKNKHFIEIEKKLSQLTEQLKENRQENDFNEIDLDGFKMKLTKLTEELDQQSNIRIQQDSTSFINKLSVIVSPEILQENNFNETDSNQITTKLTEKLDQPRNISIQKGSTSFINKSPVIVSSGNCDLISKLMRECIYKRTFPKNLE